MADPEKIDGRTAAGKLALAEAALAERDKRIAELEEALTSPSPEPEPAGGESAQYMVLSVGCPYRMNGSEAHIETAMKGQVIRLTDPEAMRLLHLDAVRAATPEEIANEPVRAAREAKLAAERMAGPTNNPYGGRALKDATEHAREQIALAKASGAIPQDTPEP